MKNFISVGIVIVIVVLAANSMFVVKETERAVLLKFGALVRSDIPPGLHFKLPWVNTYRKFDGRILTVDAPPQIYLTSEQQRLEVDSFAKWRIVDVENFYLATSGEEVIASRLISDRVNAGLRAEFGNRTLREVVSGERDELMLNLRNRLNEDTAEEYGIEVVDIRVKKIDLPPEVRESLYARMTTEKNLEAQDIRSNGNELAIGIRADADRQETIVLAEAFRDAEQIRGEGDAIATSTYAAAYEKDSEFFSFRQSINAYVDTFQSKGNILLIDPASDFFKYFKNGAVQE